MAADGDAVALLATWCPKYKPLPQGECRLRVVCFGGAGASHTLFSCCASKNNPLATMAGVELLACQLPGREARHAERPLTSAAQVAAAVLPVLTRVLSRDAVPWAVIGHSVGTWLAYEFVRAAKRAGLPPPMRMLLACFPAPHMPVHLRPWPVSARLSDLELQNEARRWHINEAVLEQPALWEAFEPLLRADYKLFDEAPGMALPGPEGQLACPMSLWFACDDRISGEMVARWGELTDAASTVRQLEGHHLFVYDAGQKADWFNDLVRILEEDLVAADQSS